MLASNRAVVERYYDAHLPGDEGRDAVALTEREQAALRCLAAGMTRDQIAAAQGRSVRTVERIITALHAKLGTSTDFCLAYQATLLGLLP